MFERTLIYCTVLALLIGPTAHAQAQGQPPVASINAAATADAERRRLNASVFSQVVRTIDQVYYDPTFKGLDWRNLSDAARPQALAAPDETALYGIMTDLLDLLEDGHVNVQGPSVWAMLKRAQAPKVSAGVSFQRRGRREQIVDVRIGTPADRAGVQIGWWLDEIDGEPFSYVDLLSALPGQTMVWTLSDEDGGVHRVSLLLEPPLPPTSPRRVDRPAHGVTRLGFDRFVEGTADWFISEVAALPPRTDLVLDLRGNSGGSLLEFQRIIGCFLPEGTALMDTRTRAGDEQRRVAMGGCPPFDGRVAVLVDRRSSSGAELLPAILVEYDRAIAVGETTAGSVLNSMTYDLPDGGLLSVTRADLWTAGGQRLEGVGLNPAIHAVTTLEDRRAGRDPALEAAVAALQTP